MKLIEDLGRQEYGTQGQSKRIGIYECPICLKHFKCATSRVKSGKSTKCRDCANKATNLAKFEKARDSFIERAIAVHGDKNFYNLIDYAGTDNKVDIGCHCCKDTYQQTPNNHLQGHGCPSCAKTGFDKTKSAILYYLKITHNNIIAYKIGITNRTIQERFSTMDLEKITIIKTWDYAIGAKAYADEQEILKLYTGFKYVGDAILSSGNTELFTIDILGLDQPSFST